MGKYDLVPAILEELGVAIHVRQVRLKPGKPFLFGTKGDALIFGLPGNPVSAFVCFELFVRPALRVLAGHSNPGPVTTSLPIAEDLSVSNDRPTYHPAKLELWTEGVFSQSAPVVGRPRSPWPATGRCAFSVASGRDSPEIRSIGFGCGVMLKSEGLLMPRVFLPAVLSGVLLWAAFFPLDLVRSGLSRSCRG